MVYEDARIWVGLPRMVGRLGGLVRGGTHGFCGVTDGIIQPVLWHEGQGDSRFDDFLLELHNG